MTAADPIPAIREEDATGETAAIFADLRATLGVPFVNLIWRHLATFPGGLAPTWTALKPLYATGTLQERRPHLEAAIALPPAEPIPAHAWDCAGIGREDRGRIGRLVGEYDAANGVNLLALSTAVSLLRGEARPGGGPASASAPPHGRSGTDAPRLLGLSELSPACLALVRDLDRFGRLGDSAAVASLYRHLAHWPAFLAMAHAALAPDHRAGTLQAAQARVVAAARAAAPELAALVPVDARWPEGEAGRCVLQALDEFTRLMIGRMVVMGHALGRLLPPEA